MKSLHIIGGNGFFGKSFLEKENLLFLKKNNISNIILSSRSTKNKTKVFKNIKIEFKKIDITKTKKLQYSDFIIFAATSSLRKNYENNLNKELKNSVKGIENILHILKQKKFLNTIFLFTSSGAVYGQNNKKIKITENFKINNYNLKNNDFEKYNYSTTKFHSEKNIKKFSKTFNRKCYVARCFAFIGNNLYLNQHYFVGNAIYAILKKKKLIINLKNPSIIYRSYMNSHDLVKSLLMIMLKSKKNFDIYNVGSDSQISIQNILNYLKNKYLLKTINLKKNKNYLDFYIPSIKKLKLITKVELSSNFKEDFHNTLKFHEKNFYK